MSISQPHHRRANRATPVSLTQRHLKLAVEQGRRETTTNRRAEIRQEIEATRSERDSIIAAGLRQQQEMSVAR